MKLDGDFDKPYRCYEYKCMQNGKVYITLGEIIGICEHDGQILEFSGERGEGKLECPASLSVFCEIPRDVNCPDDCSRNGFCLR